MLLLLLPLLSGCFHGIAATGSLVVESLSDHDILTGVCSEGVGGTSCTESSLEPTEIVLSTPTPLLPNLFEFDYEKYEAGQYIDAFFASLPNDEDENSCVDKSNDCEERAENGLCLSDPAKMNELGCHRSCLYCITQSSRELFSLGFEQIIGEDDDEDLCVDDDLMFCQENARRGFCTINPDLMEEKGCYKSCLYCRTADTEDDLFLQGVEKSIEESDYDRPSPRNVAEIMSRTEHYFVNEVLVNASFAKYRFNCKNTNALCAYWAVQGECESNPGEMGEICSAACQNCTLIDIDVRCPIDVSTNIFKPGDINAMFERWLKDAGQDVSSFSIKKLPIGGTVPGIGELRVITSPYHDPLQYPRDEDEDEDKMSPVPWVVSIDNFISDEECNRLIELGETMGYERSTISDALGDRASKERTSYNTFCEDDCVSDPLVKDVIERMTNLTGIPYDNYEQMQLVRYEPGQFYQQHHDEGGVKKFSGPRILTIFVYLNNVSSGGGTKFEYLNFTATPRKGSALIWPSMLNSLEGRDEWTWHEALPVDVGFKYGANVWIRLRDVQNAMC